MKIGTSRYLIEYQIAFLILLTTSYAQRHLGCSYNLISSLSTKMYSNSLGLEYYTIGIKKYKLIFKRELSIGMNNESKVYIRSNMVTYGIIQLMINQSKRKYPTYDNDKYLFYALFFSFLFPNGMMLTKQRVKKPIEYGIILSPFSYDFWLLNDQKIMSNYVAEIGLPFFIKTNAKQHLSLQFFISYQYNLAKDTLLPSDINKNNIFGRISISYLWGFKKRIEKIEIEE